MCNNASVVVIFHSAFDLKNGKFKVVKILLYKECCVKQSFALAAWRTCRAAKRSGEA